MKSLFAVVLLLTITISTSAQTEQDCLSSGCHDSYMQAENIHPAIEDGCDSCHDQQFENHPKRKGNEFELSSDVSTLCFDCHDTPDEKLMTHEAFASGECITCHSPHSSDNPSLLKSEDVGELCAECHDVDDKENKVKHGPAIAGQCNACHEPHQSVYSTLLKEEPPQLCFNCHTDKEEMLNMPTVHGAYEGSCIDCHNPHNSKYAFLVKDSIPNLCVDCHDDMGSEIDSAKIVHKIINQDKSCVSCHLPHASVTKYLLVKEGKELCFSCHNKKYKSKERTLKNIYKIVTKSKNKHEAVMENDCTECHFPHSSNNSFLLNAEFPFSSYADSANPDHFKLCFECHDSNALKLEKTTTATNFRNGSKNLHFLHISKNRGRNCTLCHGVHGSNNPHIIAKSVTFGKWQMPLKYKESENGGSCAPGCHALYKYDRGK